MATSSDGGQPLNRVQVFVDYWNLFLSLDRLEARFTIDWEKLGPTLARAAVEVVDDLAPHRYEGMNVYGSYNPRTNSGKQLSDWASRALAPLRGLKVDMLERTRMLQGPVCPACHTEMTRCPTCRKSMRGTEEKGVDVLIATDMLSLAWQDTYDVAVLVTSDRDFIPAAGFLRTRGIKVVQASVPPAGAQLASACWGRINLKDIRDGFRRTAK